MSTSVQTTTLSTLHREARRRLAEAGVETPDVDARILVEEFSATSRTDAVTRPDLPVGPEKAAAVEAAIGRRIAGEPVHRILGWREFHGMRLELSKHTLEPRPDTEALVELALPFLEARAKERGRASILDLGTGTGAIALALLRQVPEAEAIGTDIAPGAVETALRNAHIMGLGARFRAQLCDWFSGVDGRFDLIVSNPPYIAEEEAAELSAQVLNYDPRRALFAGDGLDAYRAIAAGAKAHLEQHGRIAVEIGYRQKEAVTGLFARSGFSLDGEAKDLGGRDRALIFRA